MAMPYTKIKTEAYKKHAEVFTPPGVVFGMILEGGIREVVKGIDKTMFDPTVGHGQFPCAELVWKMFYNLDALDEETALRALASLYGIDIQAASIDACDANLLATLADAYKFFTGKEFTRLEEAAAVVKSNFIVGDSFKIMKQWTAPQQELF